MKKMLSRFREWWRHYGFFRVYYGPEDDFMVGPEVFIIGVRSFTLGRAVSLHYDTGKYSEKALAHYRYMGMRPPRKIPPRLYLCYSRAGRFISYPKRKLLWEGKK